MLNTLNVNLNTDLKVTRVPELGIKIKSQDINNNLFILRFTDKGKAIELDETYTVEILTKFEKSKSHRLTSATVYRDYARWEFDTSFITQDEKVTNYVYVRKSGSLVVSADANAFAFDVGLSEIDKDAGRVAEVYDENYQKYLDEFKDNVDFEEIAQAEQARKEAELLREENYNQKVDTAIVEADVVAKVDNKVTELTPQINNFTEQLAKTETLIDENKPIQFKKKRPIVTFITDDGSIEDWNKLKPLSETHNIPMVAAIITGASGGLNTDYEKQKYLQNTLGWEIASHTVNHADLGTLNESQLEIELKNSKDLLVSKGLNVKNIVYPFGGQSQLSRLIAKKYYRCGVAVSHPNGTNVGVIPSFNIKRVGLGSWFDSTVSGMPATNTLEYYKARVDQCFSENSWLIFMLHPGDQYHDATQQSYLDQVIQYVKSKNIEVLTLDDAFDVFGNLWESGDFFKDPNGNTMSGVAVNKFGEEAKVITGYQMIANAGITNATAITSFPNNTFSVTSFGYSATNAFPTTAGTLHTYRVQSDAEQSHQMWYDYFSDNIYRRRWRAGAWLAWEQLVTKSYFDANMFHKYAATNAYSNASAITTFPNNSITTCYVNATGSTGLPGIAGILTTYRIGENGVHKQEYRVYNTNQIWSRFTDISTGAWTSWVKISAV